MEQETFKNWCLVELFGHQKIAGLCTEQNIAGTNMLRVDIPETKRDPAFTKYFGGSAIYAINPMDEATVRMYAEALKVSPILSWESKAFAEKYFASHPAIENKQVEREMPKDPDEDLYESPPFPGQDADEDNGYQTTDRSEGHY